MARAVIRLITQSLSLIGKQIKMTTKQTKKEKKEIKQYFQESPNNSEQCKIGEVYMSSEIIRADQLLQLIIGALENKSVKEYLELIKIKIKTGTYTG